MHNNDKNRAKQINNETRKKNNITKKKNSKYNHVKRIKNGFICEREKIIELKEVKQVKHHKNIRDGIDDSWKEHRYIFRCENCKHCPNSKICNFEEVTITTTPLKYDMENLFCNDEIIELYNERFHHSEFINGDLKGNDGTLLLPDHNKTAVNNTVHLLNTVFNVFRHKNLKGTTY